MTSPSWATIGRVAREARARDLAIVAQAAAADRVLAQAVEDALPPADDWTTRISALEERARTLAAVFALRDARHLEPVPERVARARAAAPLDAAAIHALLEQAEQPQPPETLSERVERILAEKRAARCLRKPNAVPPRAA